MCIYIYTCICVCVCVYNWITLLYSRNKHNIVNQLYTSIEKKKQQKLNPNLSTLALLTSLPTPTGPETIPTPSHFLLQLRSPLPSHMNSCQTPPLKVPPCSLGWTQHFPRIVTLLPLPTARHTASRLNFVTTVCLLTWLLGKTSGAGLGPGWEPKM